MKGIFGKNLRVYLTPPPKILIWGVLSLREIEVPIPLYQGKKTAGDLKNNEEESCHNFNETCRFEERNHKFSDAWSQVLWQNP